MHFTHFPDEIIGHEFQYQPKLLWALFSNCLLLGKKKLIVQSAKSTFTLAHTFSSCLHFD